MLGAVAAVVLLLLLRRRRRRAARRPSDAPTVPAVEGRTSGAVPDGLLPPGPPVAGRPRLVPVHGGTLAHAALGTPDAGPEELPLPPGEHVVGRAAGAAVRLEHPTVSPRHALLTVAPGGEVDVRDLGALNGLRVDGVPVASARLFDGNRLDLGEAQLVFRCDPPSDDGGRQGGELGEQPHHHDEGRD